MWLRHQGDSDAFVASVAEAGAPIVLAGRAQFGEIPDELCRACRAAGLVLVEVATEVPFTDITDFVTARDAEAWHATASLALARTPPQPSALDSGSVVCAGPPQWRSPRISNCRCSSVRSMAIGWS